MNCWAIIPVKASSDIKSRLAGVLDPDQRQALVGAMLAHVVKAARQAETISRIYLLGPSRHGLPEDLPLLEDPGGGLNTAVQSALRELAAEGPDRVLVLAADLPAVTPQELDLLTAVESDTIAIAPDRHQTGTNALSLPLPQAADFTFAFGTESCAAHRREAKRLGLGFELIRSAGLARDIDEPADLPDAETIMKQHR